MRQLGLGFATVSLTGSLIVPTQARAGIATFDQNTDSIQVSGQSVMGQFVTIEATLLIPSGAAGGLFFNEWTGFQEDKQVSISPTAFQAYLHPIQPIFNGSITLTTDEWHHIAFVHDGIASQQSFYVDGVRVGLLSAGGAAGNGEGAAYIGAIPRDGGCQPGFVGRIDSLRVSTVARYSGESASMPLGNMASDADTVLLYNFEDTPGSTTVTDSSPLERTGTLGLGCAGATSPEIGEGGTPTTTTTTSTTTTVPTTTSSTTTTTTPSGICGDPVDPPTLSMLGSLAGVVTASDALRILLVAVDADVCQLCVCDVDDSGSVTATDALIVLSHAVNPSVPLNCPPCGL